MRTTIGGLALSALAVVPALASLIVNSEVANPGNFRVTTFAANVRNAYSMKRLPDGSLIVLSSPGFANGKILRFTDTDGSGTADGPGTILYSSPHALTGLVSVGDHFAVGNLGDGTITLLKPGVTPGAPFTVAGALQLNYPEDWVHSTMGLGSRPTPGVPGSYDLVFNVGSEFDKQASQQKVGLSGLTSASLDGDSLYSVTIDMGSGQPVASNLKKVASGIRNVAGMDFNPVTGDFYFADNAMDHFPGQEDPFQADELNFISAGAFGAIVPDFGYPTCYTQYRTGVQIGAGCTSPLAAFQPIPPDSDSAQSEGPVEIAFAPRNFPAGFNNGIFIAFAGKGLTGPANEENALVYFDLATGDYVHFVKSGLPGMGRPIGLLATSNSLFVADWTVGNIYQITSTVPEPGTAGLIGVGAGLVGATVRKRRLRR